MSIISKIFRWPSSISEWIIPLGFAFYIFVDLFYLIFIDFDPFSASHEVALIEWLIRVFRDVALTTAVATMIIVGIRDIRKSGYTLKGLIYSAVGVFIIVSCLFMSVVGYQTFKKIAPHRTPDTIRDIIVSRINSTNDSINTKSKISKFYAGILFYEDGVQSNYITESGNIELYIPTNKELEQREALLKSRELSKWGMRSFYLSIYFWIAVLIMSSLLGFILPVPQTCKRSSNQGIQADAAEPRR